MTFEEAKFMTVREFVDRADSLSINQLQDLLAILNMMQTRVKNALLKRNSPNGRHP